jgi:hypothetical protein
MQSLPAEKTDQSTLGRNRIPPPGGLPVHVDAQACNRLAHLLATRHIPPDTEDSAEDGLAVQRVALIAPDALAGLLAAAEDALLVLVGMCGRPGVRPVYRRLYRAVRRARSGD